MTAPRTFFIVKPLPKKGEAGLTLDGGLRFDTLDEALAHAQAEYFMTYSKRVLRVEVTEVARIEAEVSYTVNWTEPQP